MDGATFDALLRGAARAASRRGVVRAGFGALEAALVTMLGLRAVDHAAAKKMKRKKKKKCAKTGQTPKKKKRCCKGLSKDATGRCAKPCDVCQPAGACRYETVQEAVDDAAPGATLTLCAGTYDENVTIAKNLTLIGTGDGAGPGNTILHGTAVQQTVMIIAEGTTVVLQGLRVTGGEGGGIINGGTMTLTDCTVIENEAGGAGGGIWNGAGTMTLTGCTVTGNRAGQGGGVRNNGTMTLTDCTVFGNTSDDSEGGGIYNSGTLELTNSTVTANTAASVGGGIFNSASFNNSGLVTLEGSSVTGNHAATNGGGIYNTDGGAVNCSSDSIVSDNTAGSPPVERNCLDAGGTGCATCPD